MTHLNDRSRRVFVIPRKTAAWPTAGSAIGFALFQYLSHILTPAWTSGVELDGVY